MHPNEPLGGSGACMRAGALATAPSPTCGAAKLQLPPTEAPEPLMEASEPHHPSAGTPNVPTCLGEVQPGCLARTRPDHAWLDGVRKGTLAVREGTLQLGQWTGRCPKGS